MNAEQVEKWLRGVWLKVRSVDCCTLSLGAERWGRFTGLIGKEKYALQFTREHLEDVRQLREEIVGMERAFERRWCLEHVHCVRNRAWQARVLNRLEYALAEKTRGLKPEVLENLEQYIKEGESL